ncbi:MAG: hypothetical protein ABJL99_00130 [Aliishimia sp.]
MPVFRVCSKQLDKPALKQLPAQPYVYAERKLRRAGIGKWLNYYNFERPDSMHDILTPDEAYESKI